MIEPVVVAPKQEAAKRWSALGGDHSFRVNYDLGADSVVFDVGGYEGKWASEILSRYGCRIHIFEPVPKFAAEIKRRFAGDGRVTIHEFALGDCNEMRPIFVMRDSSSFYREIGEAQEVEQVCAAEFLADFGAIDLMQINVEGGEYDLLDHLIDSSIMSRIRNLQIQFHDFVSNAETRLAAIQDGLQQTHELAFRFLFIWEGWRLKDA